MWKNAYLMKIRNNVQYHIYNFVFHYYFVLLGKKTYIDQSESKEMWLLVSVALCQSSLYVSNIAAAICYI